MWGLGFGGARQVSFGFWLGVYLNSPLNAEHLKWVNFRNSMQRLLDQNYAGLHIMGSATYPTFWVDLGIIAQGVKFGVYLLYNSSICQKEKYSPRSSGQDPRLSPSH